jgi:GT2 family glycosyltransferase
MMQLAILLTSHNRKEKTLLCLKSVQNQQDIAGIHFCIYLVDDNSSDGTAEAVKSEYPGVTVIKGSGNLFWAGGMRLAWREVINTNQNFDYYLLLNDDTLLLTDALKNLFADLTFLKKEKFILIGSTKDMVTGEFSYGGRLLKNNYNSNAEIVKPNGYSPQLCHLGNANIMLVPGAVVNDIGILSDDYTHGIADYDYTLKARKAGIPSYICAYYCGYCADDHGVNWKSADHTLRQRIQYLYSHKGLSYKEYLIFIRKFFPFYLLQAWLLLWTKTFFPFLWELRKKKKLQVHKFDVK